MSSPYQQRKKITSFGQTGSYSARGLEVWVKIPGRVGHVACPAGGFSSHRRQFQSVHLMVFTGERVAPEQD